MIKTKFQQFLIFLPSNYSKQFWVKMKGKFKSKYSTWNYFLGKLGLSTNAAVISSDDGGENWWGYCSISFFSLYRASVPFPNALRNFTHTQRRDMYSRSFHMLYIETQTCCLSLVSRVQKRKKNYSTTDQPKTTIFHLIYGIPFQ